MMKKIATALTALLVISMGVQVADASTKPVSSSKSLMSSSKFFFPKTSRQLLKPMALEVAPLVPAAPIVPAFAPLVNSVMPSISLESETVEIESETVELESHTVSIESETVEIESETVSVESHGYSHSPENNSGNENHSPSSHQPHEMTAGVPEEEGRHD